MQKLGVHMLEGLKVMLPSQPRVDAVNHEDIAALRYVSHGSSVVSVVARVKQ